jgi:hypothetical protein
MNVTYCSTCLPRHPCVGASYRLAGCRAPRATSGSQSTSAEADAGSATNQRTPGKHVECVGEGQAVRCSVVDNGVASTSQPQEPQLSIAASVGPVETLVAGALLISPFFFWGTSMVAMKVRCLAHWLQYCVPKPACSASCTWGNASHWAQQPRKAWHVVSEQSNSCSLHCYTSSNEEAAIALCEFWVRFAYLGCGAYPATLTQDGQTCRLRRLTQLHYSQQPFASCPQAQP